MTTNHSAIQDADCHEPKHFTSALTTDSGKVLTPSSVTPGISVLRFLATADLSDAVNIPKLDGSTKAMKLRVLVLPWSGTPAANSDTTDVALLTLAGATAIAAPVGTPTDGQKLAYRIVSDGASTTTWNGAFRFTAATPPTLTISSGKTDRVKFEWNAAAAKWDFDGATLNL